MYGAFDGGGAALVFCNAYVQPKQYFVFGNIAISVRNILCSVQQIDVGAGRAEILQTVSGELAGQRWTQKSPQGA
ncbi:hypothetical protein [Rugamonas rivuli]|uniref:Uncharacterized protein n=1 Tax=Rugamonas rivuli TaxID=2743358 RepID=A0A843SN65_9BURK|nr:hypothetical protein [Rugamonas rivuli]MQA23314.1 hypothetical protein [Rugamonas rivuli]